MILYCVLSAFLNAVASLVLGIAIFAKNRRDPRTVTFASVTLSVSVWSAFYLLWQVAPDASTALRHVHNFSAAAIIIPALYFHFATKLTGRDHRHEVLIGYMLSLPFIPLSFTDLIVAGVQPKMMFAHWPNPGPLYPVYLAVFFYFLLRSWQLLFLEFRKSTLLRRNQLRYVLAHTVVGFAGGATNFPLWYDVPVPPIGNIFVGVYMVGVGYAVVRFRLMEFDLLAARVVAYFSLIALLALVVPASFEALAGLSLLPENAPTFSSLFFISLIATALTFWAVAAAQPRIDAALEQRVLGDRIANRDMLRRLAGQLSSAHDEEELFDQVIAGLHEALDVSRIAIYTRTEFETSFARRTSITDGKLPPDLFAEYSPLASTLLEKRTAVLFDEIAHGPLGETQHYFAELHRRQGLELAVPIVGDNLFFGFILLGSRKSRALFNEVDISLLESICVQIAVNLRARQLERRASQTEKLIALGTLAAGLAHELRNPLTSIQTFSALLREENFDPAPLRDFGTVVQRDINRIANIVENVAAFAESNKVAMTEVQIGDVLRTVSEIARPELERSEVVLEQNIDPELPAIRGNHSQLLQVFLNLTQNAIQAMDGRGGRLVYHASLRRGDVREPRICITVQDNGPGIPPNLLPHVFEPFTTTKATGERQGKHGMGLGLAIVKRIVQHHSGEIRAHSILGQGTSFLVFLPPSSQTS